MALKPWSVIEIAIFGIGILGTYVPKNVISYNITDQPVLKYTKLIKDDSNNAILLLK